MFFYYYLKDLMADSRSVKNLKLLHKLSTQKSDEIRIQIQDCLSKIDQFKKLTDKITEEQIFEEKFSAQAEDISITGFFDTYRARQKQKLLEISKSIEEMEKIYESLSDQLREIFSEQKTYELTIEKLKKEKEEEIKIKEMLFFDEVATNLWQRK